MNEHLPTGFRFAGFRAGIKPSGKADLAIVVSERPASAAGLFTTNRVCAAPVHACRRRLPATAIQGLVVNSGNANACTGELGQADAEAMCRRLADRIGVASEQVLVCSTGIIGHPLPMERVLAGIDVASGQVAHSLNHFHEAAWAILTTDTAPKLAHRQVTFHGQTVSIVGFAKGAAMIGPNMATMLAFLLTDARVDPSLLDALLRQAVDQSFHCISVEGHTSTNDSVIMLANGGPDVEAVQEPADGTGAFGRAVTDVCQELAQSIAQDAEGASHLVIIDVSGCQTTAEARRIAKTVADSALVKTAIHGNDPNWGRICSAAGYAGVDFAETDLSLRLNGTLLYDRGTPTRFDKAAESARLRDHHDTHIELIFDLGQAHCRFWTCDLTKEYIRLNSDYTT